MDNHEALAALKSGYQQPHFLIREDSKTPRERQFVVEEDDGELLIKTRSESQRHFKVSREDIAQFAEISAELSNMKVAPSECSVCTKNYHEQVILTLGPDHTRWRHFRETLSFGDADEEDIYVEIGKPTPKFINKFRFSEHFFRLCAERIWRFSNFRDSSDISRSWSWLTTIRVHNLDEASVEEAVKRSKQIIDGCLFELGYLRGAACRLIGKWQELERPRPIRTRKEDEPELRVPKIVFNEDIVRFYLRGVASDDSVTQFLSYYQVPEYFFLRVNDAELYARLARRINDAKFTTRPRKLDRLIQDVTKSRGSRDETEMLKAVITKYITVEELVAFIQEYEGELGQTLFTTQSTLFGEKTQIDCHRDHVVGNTAKRIKLVRNALVHSSDRHERQDRHVPHTADAEERISLEAPLVKFLAEKVIVATAEPREL